MDKIKGTIYGQAIGDALGLGTEGMTEEEISQKYPNGITHYSDIYIKTVIEEDGKLVTGLMIRI